MSPRFKVGDAVRWNSEAGWIEGRITRVHTREIEFRGRTRHASEEEPQYEVTSDKTGHLAMHKETALKKIE